MNVKVEQLIQLLGKHKDDPCVRQFIRGLSINASFKKVEGAFYCTLQEHGLDIGCDDDVLTIDSIFLHSEGHEDYREFKGELPGGLSFSMNRAEIRELLGSPQSNHDGFVYRGEDVPRWDRHDIPPWDRFERGSWSLHMTYSEDLSRIEVITMDLGGPSLDK